MTETGQGASEGVQQVPRTLMFYQDPNSQQWILLPDFKQHFDNQYNIITHLYEKVNPDWSEEESNYYFTFLNTVISYMQQVYNAQIFYYEDYQAWFDFAVQQQPKGNELYLKQFNYLIYLRKKEDKDKKKEQNKGKPQPKEAPKKPVQYVEPKQKVVVRMSDPEINLQKLFSTDWDSTKYLSADFLAKQNANIVFIGHVDSGKSTLTGNIIKELKEIDEQELARNKVQMLQNNMKAWLDASVSDVIPEQRVDGKTRQYAKLNFQLQKRRFTLFDAPGHKNYVPNMITGACQADVAVLIISAKEGEFESGFEKDGQTKEHAMLAKALGVIQLITVVTKMGTVDWDQKRFDYIKDQVQPWLDNSCGFHKVAFIPVDSIQNKNIHTKNEDSFYKGPSFVDYLNDLKLPERKPMAPLRIPVIDKFKDQGKIYVYGKVQSGTIIQNQTVTVLPQRIQMVIRQIFNAKDQKMGFACAGENVKMRVKNIDEDEICRGDMVCNNLNYCQESSELKANITILDLPEEKKLLSSGYQCILHMHAIAAQAEISLVQGRLDKETNKLIKTTFLKAGEKGVCQIKIQRPICLEKYDFMHSLGRFTLRDEGKTIGFGQIIGLKPAKKLLDEQKEHLTAPGEEAKQLSAKAAK